MLILPLGASFCRAQPREEREFLRDYGHATCRTRVGRKLAVTATDHIPCEPTVVQDDLLVKTGRLPPRGGLPLGLALGVTISLLIGLLLGGLTALQLHREERNEHEARQGLLAESLAPLAAEIEQASSLGEINQQLFSGAHAEIARGHTDFSLVLSDGNDRVVGSALAGFTTSPPQDSLQARMPVRSTLLAKGRGTLTAWQGDSDFVSASAARRRAAWLEIGATILAIIVVVQLAIYLLVTRPLNRLLTSIEKVEMGYPAKPPQDDIARELRWLAWRFYRMSTTLADGARLLIAAHRRAIQASKTPPDTGIDPKLFDPLKLDRPGPSADLQILRHYLRNRCALLEESHPGNPQARDTALEIWKYDAVEAEKLGEMELCARIENAALKILNPRAFDRVQRALDILVDARAEWCASTEEVIKSGLAADGVPLIAFQQRTKHTAGVWRKMQERGLLLEEVQDLLAFRIVVPNQDSCYLALDTVHRLFEPEPFRFKDYIADPKANGYQSLHTSVRTSEGLVFEVQIRTIHMHRAAEEGASAHWRYRSRKPIHV